MTGRSVKRENYSLGEKLSSFPFKGKVRMGMG